MRTRIHRTAALAVSALLMVSVFTACKKEETATDDGPKIGYADATMIVDDADALAKAIADAEARAKEPNVSVYYSPTAVSENGIDFTCQLGNAANSAYDEFITVYGDSAYTDELYVSQLLRPGYTLDHITLNHPLEPGTHPVYISFTQVDTAEDGTQTLKKSAFITMDFTVKQ